MPSSSGLTYRHLLDRWLDSHEAWLRVAGNAWSLAPDLLVQPVNPGWMFGNIIVNAQNSADPAVEQEIVEQVSYGRQLGRILEAVEVLVAKVDRNTLSREERRALEGFDEIVEIVDRAKRSAMPPSDAGMRELAKSIAALAHSLQGLQAVDLGTNEGL
jgi:hypothetical protein